MAVSLEIYRCVSRSGVHRPLLDMMFAHLIACFLQCYQKTWNNNFPLLFHVASGIVSKTSSSTVYGFYGIFCSVYWSFNPSCVIDVVQSSLQWFKDLSAKWKCLEEQDELWQTGSSSHGVYPFRFSLSHGVSHCWHSSELTGTFLIDRLNGFIYRYWVFFHTSLFILLCCFCFPLGVRDEESLPFPPSTDQLSVAELLGSPGLLVCVEAAGVTERSSLWSCIRQFVFIFGTQ